MFKKSILSVILLSSLLSVNTYAAEKVGVKDGTHDTYIEVTTSGGKIAKIDNSVSTALNLIAKHATGFYTGEKKEGDVPAIVFFDPECSYCKQMWNEISNMKENPRVLWIPVGILGGEKSEKEAAIILSSANPKEVMDKLANKIDISNESVSKQGLANTQMNNLLFGSLGFSSFPTTLKVTKDQFIYLHPGLINADKFREVINY